jgi:hypothetical protein
MSVSAEAFKGKAASVLGLVLAEFPMHAHDHRST